MTGIKYMDELAAPRRSIHPGMQPITQSRSVSDIPLAEFVMAMSIDVPQLDLYSRVSRDLEAWIEKSKVVFAQAEEEAAKVTPELFIEYARADEVGREELGVNTFPNIYGLHIHINLQHQLTLIRTHTRYLARSDWYDWKLQWVEGLRHTASEAFKSLEDVGLQFMPIHIAESCLGRSCA
jgi:kinetochore protein Spc7/SPC105